VNAAEQARRELELEVMSRKGGAGAGRGNEMILESGR